MEIKDLEALGQAAAKCGLELVEGQKSYHWFGTHMGDYPLPEGIKAEDLGKCDHALRVKDPGSKKPYEIGVVNRGDGTYTLLWDFFAGGYGLMEKVAAAADIKKEGLGKLLQEYSAAVTRKQVKKLKRMGFRVREVRDGDKIKLVARR